MRSSLSFDCFKRVRHHIEHALANWPAPIIYGVHDLSPVTFAALLRDAKLAKQRYDYKLSTPELEKLWKAYGSKLTISELESQVRVGPKQTPKNKRELPKVREATITFTPRLPQHLYWLCELISMTCFSPPIQVEVKDINDLQIKNIEQKFNVAFVPTDEANTYTLA